MVGGGYAPEFPADNIGSCSNKVVEWWHENRVNDDSNILISYKPMQRYICEINFQIFLPSGSL